MHGSSSSPRNGPGVARTLAGRVASSPYPDIAILTNARVADQRSMIGYGHLLLDAARRSGYATAEFRAISLCARLAPGRVAQRLIAKLLANVDRFVATPLALAGRRAAIVHVVDPGNAPYLRVLRYQAAIVTVHDLIPYLCASGRLTGFRPTAAGRTLMAEILHQLQRADRVVCVSENTRRDLLSLVDIDPNRVVTIPNAVFQPMQRASDAACGDIRSWLRLPPEAPIILHVGSNAFYKNRLTVIDVFAGVLRRHGDARLLFVGPRSADLVNRAAALGLSDRVRYAERVDGSQLAAIYSAARVLLFPSLYEGFGYPVLEAQLCGTPVVCSNAGSLPEVGGDAALTAAPLDVAGLTAAVDQVLSDPALAERMQHAGSGNARRFHPLAWIEAHRRLYDRLLSSLAM